MKKIAALSPDLLFAISAVLLMLLALPFRLFNLHYNSAFNDEAIYIIVGLMGIFERDWWTYNAAAWIPGVQYFYPSMTAIAFSLGGLEGSRFLNVLFSVFTILLIFLLTATIYQKLNKLKKITYTQVLASTIAALIVGGSEISHYIARLATYDTPSFMFLFLGLVLLMETKTVRSGNRYFSASLFLSLSYLAKIITGIYLPFIALFFYFQTKSVSKVNSDFYKRYFLIPFLIIFAVFVLFNSGSLFGYYNTQQSLEKASFESIINLVWQKTSLPIIFGLAGLLGFVVRKQLIPAMTLSVAASLIILFHLATSRTLSLDKHLFLFVAFLSMIAGIGLTNLITLFKPQIYKLFTTVVLAAFIAMYWSNSYKNIDFYNKQWKDMSVISEPLKNTVKANDKVLAESGSAVILETYYQNFPPNTSTFDWLEYRNQTGDKAFELAVRDGYFDVIQLESSQNSKSERNAHLSNLVRRSMESNYRLAFDSQGFQIYKRAF
jgi:hypothetical protein